MGKLYEPREITGSFEKGKQEGGVRDVMMEAEVRAMWREAGNLPPEHRKGSGFSLFHQSLQK